MPNAIKKSAESRIGGNHYTAIRTALLARGTNLKRWAEANSYPLTTVYLAASGKRAGIKSIYIRNELLRYVGLN